MRYAMSVCRQDHVPDGIKFTGPCIITGKEQSVVVSNDELIAYKAGAIIQRAMSRLSPEEREFLISGISAEGWKKLCDTEF